MKSKSPFLIAAQSIHTQLKTGYDYNFYSCNFLVVPAKASENQKLFYKKMFNTRQIFNEQYIKAIKKGHSHSLSTGQTRKLNEIRIMCLLMAKAAYEYNPNEFEDIS